MSVVTKDTGINLMSLPVSHTFFSIIQYSLLTDKMRFTSVAILLATVLTGLVTAMPSADDNGGQARRGLYGYVRIEMPKSVACFHFLMMS